MASLTHVLVVEDEPLVRDVIIDALDGLYRTSHAGTAAGAMDCLRGGDIDAMLLDCTLPGGLDPALVPMADQSGVPVILMSGYPDVMERVPGAGRLAIQKPFSLSALLDTIERAVASTRVA